MDNLVEVTNNLKCSLISIDGSEAAAKVLTEIDEACFGEEKMSFDEWFSAIVNDNTYIVLASVDNVFVGAAVARITPFKIGYIYSYAVLKECRGYGIATLLLGDCLRELKERNCSLIQAHTRIDNEPSGNVLRKANFHPIQYVPDFYDDFQDAILWQQCEN